MAPIQTAPKILHGCFVGSKAMHERLQNLTRNVAYNGGRWSVQLEKIPRDIGTIASVMERSLFTNNVENLALHPRFIAIDSSDPDSLIKDIGDFAHTYTHYIFEGLPFVAITNINPTENNPLKAYHRIERMFGDFTVDIGGHPIHPISKMFDLNAALSDDSPLSKPDILAETGIPESLLPRFFSGTDTGELTFLPDINEALNTALTENAVTSEQAGLLARLRLQTPNDGAYLAFSRFMLAIDKTKELKTGRIDFLTGLHSERSIKMLLEHEIDKAIRERTKIALMYLDLKKFKEINDDYSHEAGDKVLQAVADILRASVRGSDIVGRPHGDEFYIIFPEIDGGDLSKDINDIFERIRHNLGNSQAKFKSIHADLERIEAAMGAFIIDFSSPEGEIFRDFCGVPERSLSDGMIHIADLMSYISRHNGTGQPSICTPVNIKEAVEKHARLKEIHGNERS